MKVLYIASGTSMSGGATKSLLAMIHQAGEAGIDYEVVCPDEKGLAAFLKKEGVKVHVVHFRHACLPLTDGFINKVKWLPRLIHNTWINIKARASVTEIARNAAPDIIHENSSVIDVGYHAAKRLGIPDIIHIREYGDLDFKMKLPGRDRRLSDPNVYTISITKDIAAHKRQDRNAHGIQIYNGIIKSNQLRHSECKKPYFLYAGHITEDKGITDLLRAYIEYAHSTEDPMKLLIAGNCYFPGYLRRMKAMVKAIGLEKKVQWLGEVCNVGDLMYEATATIIPSKFEGLGRVMPEAMSNGCLCIGRYTGGTREQMDNGSDFIGSPIAIPFVNVEDLTEILKEVDKKARVKGTFEPGGEYFDMIMKSQRSVLEFFSEEQFGSKIKNFYSSILAAHDTVTA